MRAAVATAGGGGWLSQALGSKRRGGDVSYFPGPSRIDHSSPSSAVADGAQDGQPGLVAGNSRGGSFFLISLCPRLTLFLKQNPLAARVSWLDCPRNLPS